MEVHGSSWPAFCTFVSPCASSETSSQPATPGGKAAVSGPRHCQVATGFRATGHAHWQEIIEAYERSSKRQRLHQSVRQTVDEPVAIGHGGLHHECPTPPSEEAQRPGSCILDTCSGSFRAAVSPASVTLLGAPCGRPADTGAFAALACPAAARADATVLRPWPVNRADAQQAYASAAVPAPPPWEQQQHPPQQQQPSQQRCAACHNPGCTCAHQAAAAADARRVFAQQAATASFEAWAAAAAAPVLHHHHHYHRQHQQQHVGARCSSSSSTGLYRALSGVEFDPSPPPLAPYPRGEEPRWTLPATGAPPAPAPVCHSAAQQHQPAAEAAQPARANWPTAAFSFVFTGVSPEGQSYTQLQYEEQHAPVPVPAQQAAAPARTRRSAAEAEHYSQQQHHHHQQALEQAGLQPQALQHAFAARMLALAPHARQAAAPAPPQPPSSSGFAVLQHDTAAQHLRALSYAHAHAEPHALSYLQPPPELQQPRDRCPQPLAAYAPPYASACQQLPQVAPDALFAPAAHPHDQLRASLLAARLLQAEQQAHLQRHQQHQQHQYQLLQQQQLQLQQQQLTGLLAKRRAPEPPALGWPAALGVAPALAAGASHFGQAGAAATAFLLPVPVQLQPLQPQLHFQLQMQPSHQQQLLRLALAPQAAAAAVAAPLPVAVRLPLAPPAGLHPEEWVCAATRCLGCTEPDTPRMALHCWRRVQRLPQMARGRGAGRNLYAAACVWIAIKLEEQRRPDGPGGAALSALTGAPTTALCAAELTVMGWLGWRPYEGYRLDESHLLMYM